MPNKETITTLSSANASFIEELYDRFMCDPNSVDESWQIYFKSLSENKNDVQMSFSAAPWKPRKSQIINTEEKKLSKVEITDNPHSTRVEKLIDAYQRLGHLYVQYDPLNLVKPDYHPDLDYKTYGFTENDLSLEVDVSQSLGFEKISLEQVIAFLMQRYCSRVGAEYMYIENAQEKAWLNQKILQSNDSCNLTAQEKRKTLFDLLEAENFENFLHTKFPGTKRFSIEGGEVAIAAIECIVAQSSLYGVSEVVIGMAHRGRLNTLTKIMDKPYHAMLSEFKGELAFPSSMSIPGDVKYHLGMSSDIDINGKSVHLSLAPNPSHLEIVNSVVLGKVRAKQDMKLDKNREEVLAILIHGDAAFAGQGSVSEMLSLSQLKGFHTGGTMHVVINNQIGFTTNVSDARSSRYCTDIAKMIDCPVFHVNGDDAEAIIFVTKLAAEYRARFKKDIIIDIICYRKYGHNEGDEPFFTQPSMYREIEKHQTPVDIYVQKLISEGVITEAEYSDYKDKFKTHLSEEYEKSLTYKPVKADWLEGAWSGFKQPDINRAHEITGVAINTLRDVGKKLCEYPTDFNINAKVERQLRLKQTAIESGLGIDWATGEALAFGSLINEGFNIRMTGQDVKRGTFSHRHAVFFDQETESEFVPLNNLQSDQKNRLEIHNSNLSELAVMGFEYGYSFTDPNTLVLWEGQFGDFANGAQVMIDQYIASGEAKWLRMNSLVLLLPHGYEGAGPEHSSARLERFLQLCAMDNMQVVNCSTPASYFHVLRRQMKRDFRKPLIVMSPKSLLRHKMAVSSLNEMDEGTAFKPVIDEAFELNQNIKRAVICSGKVYYDLLEKRNELDVKDIALIRLEQFYPFPHSDLSSVLTKYSNAEIIWCQEEHKNMGAFNFVEPKIETVLSKINHPQGRAKYVGRDESASPSVGYMKLHIIEHKKLLDEIFN